jgi:outer membrane protein assembly factor BamA
VLIVERQIDFDAGLASAYYIAGEERRSSINYAEPFAAYVSDNALFGYTGPISGRRFRFQIEPTLGSFRWIDYQADYRRYFPILFNYLTFATRAMSSLQVGRDEKQFPNYIGRPEFVRGYDRESFFSNSCYTIGGASPQGCSAVQLLGSRVALANAELRFPVVRRFELGILPIALPPLDGLVFYDAGLAWSSGQTVYLQKPASYDLNKQRYVLTSYGLGLRLNLFGFAILRWDYAIPLDRPKDQRHGFWTWSLGPSF